MTTLRIGVVGYCPPTKFDESIANELLATALDAVLASTPDATDIWIVSGLCDVGVPSSSSNSQTNEASIVSP